MLMRASVGFLGTAMISGITLRSIQGIVTWGSVIPLDSFFVLLRIWIVPSTVYALVGWIGFIGVLACRRLLGKSMLPGRPLVLSAIAAIIPSVLGHAGALTWGAVMLQERANLHSSMSVLVLTTLVVASAVSTTVTLSLGQRYEAHLRATNG